ncbi:hypothetical protein ACM66Z_07530 [Sulfurovum sp. ST-21]|uniref:Uncharacterized protein n=1 Tax=Sulfurovum indicum TaxID=2779528 RepID=A0A7M1S1J2_9BACT|nr:hypothetical protein [Sulfurovum indicum]QOR61297.1 hypothetical protein IMZ28_07525 [Sulfurovum indicum]
MRIFLVTLLFMTSLFSKSIDYDSDWVKDLPKNEQICVVMDLSKRVNENLNTLDKPKTSEDFMWNLKTEVYSKGYISKLITKDIHLKKIFDMNIDLLVQFIRGNIDSKSLQSAMEKNTLKLIEYLKGNYKVENCRRYQSFYKNKIEESFKILMGYAKLAALDNNQKQRNKKKVEIKKLSEEQMNLIKVVINTEGFINEDLYNEFWKGIKTYKLNQESRKLIEEEMIFVQQIQFEIWNSALESIKQKKVYKTEKLKKLIQKAYTLFSKNPTYDYKQIQSSIDKIDILLNSAVDQTPYYANGNVIYITQDLVNQVLSGLDASIERIKMLIEPNWNPIVKERYLNDYANVLWHLPLTKSFEIIKIDGVDKKFISYSSIMDFNSVVSISFIESKISNTRACIKGIANRLGEDTPIILDKYFNGFSASEASFNINDTNGKVYINAQCIATKNHQYSILSISNNNVDSLNYYNELLKKLIIKK